MSLRDELSVATDLALDVGAALRGHRAAGPLQVMRKSGGEAVTAADLESDTIIRRGLAEAFPTDALFTEESPDRVDRFGNHRAWIVDPLDSTSNCIFGADESSVSIGPGHRRPTRPWGGLRAEP